MLAVIQKYIAFLSSFSSFLFPKISLPTSLMVVFSLYVLATYRIRLFYPSLFYF